MTLSQYNETISCDVDRMSARKNINVFFVSNIYSNSKVYGNRWKWIESGGFINKESIQRYKVWTPKRTPTYISQIDIK